MSNKNKFRDAILSLEKEFWEAFNKEAKERAANNPNWWGGCDEALEQEMREEWGFPYEMGNLIHKMKQDEEWEQLQSRAAAVGAEIGKYAASAIYELRWKDGSFSAPDLKSVIARLELEERAASGNTGATP